jgi:hypothetical protein
MKDNVSYISFNSLKYNMIRMKDNASYISFIYNAMIITTLRMKDNMREG